MFNLLPKGKFNTLEINEKIFRQDFLWFDFSNMKMQIKSPLSGGCFAPQPFIKIATFFYLGTRQKNNEMNVSSHGNL